MARAAAAAASVVVASIHSNLIMSTNLDRMVVGHNAGGQFEKMPAVVLLVKKFSYFPMFVHFNDDPLTRNGAKYLAPPPLEHFFFMSGFISAVKAFERVSAEL